MKSQCPIVDVESRFNMVESARILGVSRSTLYRYIQDGSIKFGIRKVNGGRFLTGKQIIQIWKEVI